jgi:hypothetical protein
MLWLLFQIPSGIKALHIPTFQHSNIPTFQHSNIPIFQHSNIPIFQHSNIPIFQHSNIPIFQYSNIPTFQHSNIPVLQPSILPLSKLVRPLVDCRIIKLSHFSILPLFHNSIFSSIPFINSRKPDRYYKPGRFCLLHSFILPSFQSSTFPSFHSSHPAQCVNDVTLSQYCVTLSAANSETFVL